MTEKWLFERLSALLDFPVPQDLIMYILSIENYRDLEDFLKTLLDFSNPQHEQLFLELLSKQQIKSTATSNKTCDVEMKYNVSLKAKGKSSEVDSVSTKQQSIKQEQTVKKKSRFVNLYSPEGQTKDVIQLKGRHQCDCQASKHKLINNCLTCGRIVCSQEGSGPCLVCSSLVCTREEQEALSAGTKRSDRLYQKLVDQKKPQGWEDAMQHRNRLLEYDRSCESRTKVIDDENDYFSTRSVWLSKQERDKLKQREDEIKAKRHGSRLDRKITFDFAGRQVVEDPDDSLEFDPENDPVLQEISQSVKNSSSPMFNDENIHPRITCSHPIFQDTVNSHFKTKKSDVNRSEHILKHRVQDRQLIEMTDEGVCLSMHQPWASLLVAGIKTDEGRSWYSSHRGRLWIASASKPPDLEIIKETERACKLLLGDENIQFPAQYPVSCLLGCVNVVDVLPQEEYRKQYPDGESDCPFVFICEDPQELPIHFPMQGKHKIYKMDSKIHQAAQKSLLRLAKIQSERQF